MRPPTITLALAIWIATTWGAPARAQVDEPTPLAEADRLFDLGDLEGSRSAYQTRIESGSLESADLAQAYRRLGVLAATVNDSVLAERWFDRSLALAPAQPAPDALSPSQQELFEAVRVRRNGASAVLSIETATEPPPHGEPVAVEVHLSGLAGDWSTVYRLSAGSWSETQRLPSFAIPSSAFGEEPSIALRAEALDEHGNVIARASAEAQAPASADPNADPNADPLGHTSSSSQDEPPRRTGLWVGLALIAAAAVAVAIIVPIALTRDDPSYGLPVIEW